MYLIKYMTGKKPYKPVMKRSTFILRHRELRGLRARRAGWEEMGFGGRTEPATVGETEWELREQHPAYASMRERAEFPPSWVAPQEIIPLSRQYRDRVFLCENVPVRDCITIF